MICRVTTTDIFSDLNAQVCPSCQDAIRKKLVASVGLQLCRKQDKDRLAVTMKQGKPKRATLQTIADHVGTTRMTVSRCLRDPRTVSESLRARILTAVDELNYLPNRAPQLLALARSQSIGVLVPSVTNQVFADVLAGIIDTAESADYRAIIAHYGYDPKQEERNVAALLSFNADALILSDRDHTADTLRMIDTAGVPVIELMDTRMPALQQAVGYDNQSAAEDMVEAMIAEGRQHIVYLALRLDERTLQREFGYSRAMERHGLKPVTLRSTQKSSFTVGATLMGELMESMPDTDGVFCTNDDVAVGAYFECLARGINVPQALRISGFHGLDVSRALYPALASVLTPRYEIGQRSVSEILRRIDGGEVTQPQIDLGYRITIGENAEDSVTSDS